MTLQAIPQSVPSVPLIGTPLDTDAAFAHKGAKAAVFKPRFGQAHQQYFTPRWLCEAGAAGTRAGQREREARAQAGGTSVNDDRPMAASRYTDH